MAATNVLAYGRDDAKETVVVSKQLLLHMLELSKSLEDKIACLQRRNDLFAICLEGFEMIIREKEILRQKRFENLSQKIQRLENKVHARYQALEDRIEKIEKVVQEILSRTQEQERRKAQQTVISRSWSVSDDLMPESSSENGEIFYS